MPPCEALRALAVSFLGGGLCDRAFRNNTVNNNSSIPEALRELMSHFLAVTPPTCPNSREEGHMDREPGRLPMDSEPLRAPDMGSRRPRSPPPSRNPLDQLRSKAPKGALLRNGFDAEGRVGENGARHRTGDLASHPMARPRSASLADGSHRPRARGVRRTVVSSMHSLRAASAVSSG